MKTIYVARMHSSRMRVARSSSRLLGGVSASVHVGMSITPGEGLETPLPLGVGLKTPQCGPEDPPGRGPPECGPPGVGLETPQARPLNFPPGCSPGDPC